MKMSRRAQRMERHHKKSKSMVALNLVSLMDIFTILVFFLLVSSSEVEILPSSQSIDLPESEAQMKPRETITIMVSADEISIKGMKIASVKAVLNSQDEGIYFLQETLEGLASKQLTGQHSPRPEVTIMAEKTMPYKLLKKIMLSCRQAKYGTVSFAVMQKLSNISE